MDENERFAFMKRTAAIGLYRQERHEGDYEDKYGMLICGKCKEPRQKILKFPYDDDGEQKVFRLKVTCHCKCERAQDVENERIEREKQERKLIDSLKQSSLMDEQFSIATFDRFEVDQTNDEAHKICLRYVENFDTMVQNNRGLLFWGSVGTGKSFAAACIANALLAKRVPVIMTSFVKILSLLQSREEQDIDVLRRMEKAKLVIFDDLGAERGTDYALEKVYEIVDGRYRQSLPMIFTTNLSLDQMKTEMDIRYNRIYDRIIENCFPVEFRGASWRKAQAGQRHAEMRRLLGIE